MDDIMQVKVQAGLLCFNDVTTIYTTDNRAHIVNHLRKAIGCREWTFYSEYDRRAGLWVVSTKQGSPSRNAQPHWLDFNRHKFSFSERIAGRQYVANWMYALGTIDDELRFEATARFFAGIPTECIFVGGIGYGGEIVPEKIDHVLVIRGLKNNRSHNSHSDQVALRNLSKDNHDV